MLIIVGLCNRNVERGPTGPQPILFDITYEKVDSEDIHIIQVLLDIQPNFCQWLVLLTILFSVNYFQFRSLV